jgi:hypothetical protein
MAVKLVRASGMVCVQFSCAKCGRNIVAKLEDVGGDFTCRSCGTRVTMPAVPCADPACSGTYAKCGGKIQKLPHDVIRKNEAAAWEGAPEASGRATDDAMDDYRDRQGSIITHQCTGCGTQFTARQETQLLSSTCREVVCVKCKRSAERRLGELPEPG